MVFFEEKAPEGSLDAALRKVATPVARRVAFHKAARPDTLTSSAAVVPLNPPKPASEKKKKDKQAPVPAGDGFNEAKFSLFSPDNVQLPWAKVQGIGAGLQNLGNTCFMNSVLQCLTYIPPLANYVQGRKHSHECAKGGFCTFCLFEDHVGNALSGKRRVVTPKSFAVNLRQIGKTLRHGRQEDSHEFLRYLIDRLQQACVDAFVKRGAAVPRPPEAETTVIHRIFGGHFRSQIMCDECGHPSNTFESFLDISLEIKNCDSIGKALQRFTRRERLDQNNKYKCSGCRKDVCAYKQFSLYRLPPALVIHLKRFSAFGGKINIPIKYPATLDMAPFCSDKNQRDARYRLCGVLVHMGHSTHSGHYYSYVLAPNLAWHLMNDDSVKTVSQENALRQQGAYMLFYVRESAFEPSAAPSKPAEAATPARAAASATNGTKPPLAPTTPGLKNIVHPARDAKPINGKGKTTARIDSDLESSDDVPPTPPLSRTSSATGLKRAVSFGNGSVSAGPLGSKKPTGFSSSDYVAPTRTASAGAALMKAAASDSGRASKEAPAVLQRSTSESGVSAGLASWTITASALASPMLGSKHRHVSSPQTGDIMTSRSVFLVTERGEIPAVSDVDSDAPRAPDWMVGDSSRKVAHKSGSPTRPAAPWKEQAHASVRLAAALPAVIAAPSSPVGQKRKRSDSESVPSVAAVSNGKDSAREASSRPAVATTNGSADAPPPVVRRPDESKKAFKRRRKAEMEARGSPGAASDATGSADERPAPAVAASKSDSAGAKATASVASAAAGVTNGAGEADGAGSERPAKRVKREENGAGVPAAGVAAAGRHVVEVAWNKGGVPKWELQDEETTQAGWKKSPFGPRAAQNRQFFAPVESWADATNEAATQAEILKDLDKGRKRKRSDWDMALDRGKQKKVKVKRDPEEPSVGNQFQEVQNRKLQAAAGGKSQGPKGV